METQVLKGRGYVYIQGEQMYKQVKRNGDNMCLKCIIDACDGSARIQRREFIV